MTRFGYVAATVLVVDLFAALFLAQHWRQPRPRLLWNASASAPIGLYRVAAIDHPRVGDLVVLTPPALLAGLMARRGYLPRGVPLVKRVAGLPGARICRDGSVVTIAGHAAAIARPRDAGGRALPSWRGCRVVGGGELLLLNPGLDSFDGRYFGAIEATGLVGRAIPILTREAAHSPLRWHGWRGAAATPLLSKGGKSCH
ncbi:S26 family signal peptidase [Novosphingobium sp. P6W]|uniref:S26 family signal peptidase n=1 Tax=Novosphingobium sp. P6W TaxID=1609758 RepID=UPI0005C2FC91|nr:S26 family signal peptidase [Novosphingobium sp. P6W]AXB76598.1 S26 family signal peptidase [Novosphingobium sp. P6W]KIS33493.1 conjugal transfer protein [Novosphingobium sp. P6W]